MPLYWLVKQGLDGHVRAALLAIDRSTLALFSSWREISLCSGQRARAPAFQPKQVGRTMAVEAGTTGRTTIILHVPRTCQREISNQGNLEQYSLSAISVLVERAVAALVPR